MAKSKSEKRLKVAVLGGETLLGKEVAEVLTNRLPAVDVATFAATGEGNFGEAEGEAVYVEPLDAQTTGDVQAIVIAGTQAGAEKAYEIAKGLPGKPVVIDGTGYLEHLPGARFAGPLPTDVDVRQSQLWAIAHPAASALALVLSRLAKRQPLLQVVAHVFEPASEYGKKGVSELHQQTTSLLSFKPLEKETFDAQLSYNLLAQFGEEAPVKLATTEARIERHVAAMLSAERESGRLPIPSIRLVGAPVFHGYSLSIWAEFDRDVSAPELGEALASAQVEIRSQTEEPPHNVGATGQSGLIAGDIRVDRNNSRAAWFWVVGDNLRLVADAAADLVKNLGESTR